MNRIPVAIAASLVVCTTLSLGCTGDRQVDDLQREIIALEMEVLFLKAEMEGQATAFLRPGAAGYSTIRFDLGVLTIRIDDVIEYANGSKVTLVFGNPLSSTITSLKAKIAYGEVDENNLAQKETTKTKEVTISEPLISGSWTSVSVVLDGVPASKLGFVRVQELTHTGISLTAQ